MSNPNISTRRATLNKISAESQFNNSAFLPLKSPNFPQAPSQEDDDFEAPKPTKKIKAGKSAENSTSTASSGTDWSSSFLPSSIQLDELIKKQAPDFLENIQLKVVDENWEREALKQIKNSSLHKLLNSNVHHGLEGFKAENGGQKSHLELLEPREIFQLIEKMNHNIKQEVPHFPKAQDKLPLGQLVIPDLPVDLQNALDELLYQTPILPKAKPLKVGKKQKAQNKSYIQKTNGAHDAHEVHPDQNQIAVESLESPQNTDKRPTRSAQSKLAKSKVEKTAVNELINLPPKELLGKRSPPETDPEPQNQTLDVPTRRATRRSQQQTPQNQQTETPPKTKPNKNAFKSPPQIDKKNSEEEKITKKRSSAKQNKAEQPAPPTLDRTSTEDEDSLDMPFRAFNKKIAAAHEEDAMEIEEKEYIQRIVNIKIGKSYQINPLPLVLNKERPRRQIKKIIWSPKNIEVKAYEDYIDQFQNVIEKEITNVEIACKTLIKFDMDSNKAIENIKRNVAYYKNQMIPGQRVLRTRFAFS